MRTEQRHNQRILFDTPATVHADKGDWSSSVIDVSLQGILVKTPPGWSGKVGDHCTVNMQLEGGIVITMQTSIAHIEQDYVGMHCDNIDIDSATHLRRLVELNLGDEELLNRELATLQRN